MTFDEFVTRVYDTVDIKADRVLPYIKDAAVRWLKELSQERMTLLESTFQFALVEGQQTYDSTVSGFPVDVMSFDNVWASRTTDTTGRRWELRGPVAVAEVSLLANQASTSPPTRFAFHDNRLWIGPPPPADYILGGEYLRNGLKDSATGNLITASSTTATNPWFDRGEFVLRNMVLADVYASVTKDFQVAAVFDQQGRDGLARLRGEQQIRSSQSRRIAFSLGGMRG